MATIDPRPMSSAGILIVDDEPYIRDVLCRWLEAEGYVCATAGSAEEAFDLLAGQSFALLVSDITMPGKSGIDLLTEVRERYADMAVIMVTAVDDRQTAINTLKLGAFGYVIKPFDRNEVVINVANALERRRLVLMSQRYERQLEAEVRERTADVRRREEEIAIRLVSASEYRDEETGAHIRRIGLYVAVLAEALGWAPERTDDIRIAGPMHDIGKIGVPDGILLKPGKLTAEEFETMKEHAEIGAGILSGSSVPALCMARDIARAHHEKWSGAGYPRSASGEAIPEAARLAAVADVYDALVHKRVYRPALPEDEALAIMAADRGTHFDQRVFDCFLDVLPQFRQIQEQVDDEQEAVDREDPLTADPNA